MTLSCVDFGLKGRVLVVLTVCAFNLSGIVGANAEPAISAVQVADEVKQGSVITLSGKGFGRKLTAAPVFVDYVEEAYENGKRRRVYSNFDDGTKIEPASNDSQSLWAAATSSLPVRYDNEKVNARHQFDEARYHFYGENSWLGRPVIYGGVSGWDTPYNNQQIYVSWWVKVDYNSTYYWRINPLKITGQFSPGELVAISGEIAGEYIGKDDDGLLNFVFPGHINANNLVNQNLQGLASKASAVFPDSPRGGEGYGFESPGTKYMRIWDDPKSQGIRASLSLTDYYVASTSNSSFGTGVLYQRRDMDPDRWHHFEFEIDTARGVVRSWFDGEIGSVGAFDPRAAFQDGFSPTIALIGNNAKQDKLQNLYISEIYMDSSIQRVIVGDAPNYSDLSHYELQRPVFWDDGNIKFAVNFGALSPSSELYIYVFDEDGNPNKQGFALCSSVECPSPPEPIQLQIN